MSDGFLFDASEISDFGAAMATAPELVHRELSMATTEALTLGAELAQGFAPVKMGALRDSIHVLRSAILGGGAFGGAWGTSKIYAWIREKGGTIVGNPWLVFQVGGRWVKVRSVTQQGTRYMERSAQALRPRLRGIYGAALDRVWSRIMARGG